MIFEFKPRREPQLSDDPWYDLTVGGYIKPEELLEDPKQVEQLEDAIKIVYEFLDQAEKTNTIEIC